MESGSGQVRYGCLRVRYILAQVIHGHRHECQCKPSFRVGEARVAQVPAKHLGRRVKAVSVKLKVGEAEGHKNGQPQLARYFSQPTKGLSLVRTAHQHPRRLCCGRCLSRRAVSDHCGSRGRAGSARDQQGFAASRWTPMSGAEAFVQFYEAGFTEPRPWGRADCTFGRRVQPLPTTVSIARANSRAESCQVGSSVAAARAFMVHRSRSPRSLIKRRSASANAATSSGGTKRPVSAGTVSGIAPAVVETTGSPCNVDRAIRWQQMENDVTHQTRPQATRHRSRLRSPRGWELFLAANRNRRCRPICPGG
jgi:hypothetical protein